jgi:transcriptional regulator with XRE-family HTH domain
MNDNQRVGIAVKMKRVEKGLKQVDLAKIIGTHRSVISHIETGLPHSLGKRTVERLSSALGLPEDWIDKARRSYVPEEINPQVRIPEEYTAGFPGTVQRGRINKLISQVDLAAMSEVPLSTIVELELGRGRPTIEGIVSIMRTLDLDIPRKVREYLSIYAFVDVEELHERHVKLCYTYRRERRSRRIGLATLAEDLLMDKGNLSKIERGHFDNLQSKTMIKLTDVLGLPEEWFDITYRKSIAPADNKSWLCPRCLRMWSRYRIKCSCIGDIHGR